MRVATADAKEMAALSADALVLNIHLTAATVGEAFDCLSPHEWDRAKRWEAVLGKLGIKVWEEQP